MNPVIREIIEMVLRLCRYKSKAIPLYPSTKSHLIGRKPSITFLIDSLYESPSGSNNLHCRLHGLYFFIPRKNTGTNGSPLAVAFDMERYYK